MKVITYNSLAKLNDAAREFNLKLHHTLVSYSFRIFDCKGLTKELHIFKIK